MIRLKISHPSIAHQSHSCLMTALLHSSAIFVQPVFVVADAEARVAVGTYPDALVILKSLAGIDRDELLRVAAISVITSEKDHGIVIEVL